MGADISRSENQHLGAVGTQGVGPFQPLAPQPPAQSGPANEHDQKHHVDHDDRPRDQQGPIIKKGAEQQEQGARHHRQDDLNQVIHGGVFPEAGIKVEVKVGRAPAHEYQGQKMEERRPIIWRNLTFKTQQVRRIQGNKPQGIINNEQGEFANVEMERIEWQSQGRFSGNRGHLSVPQIGIGSRGVPLSKSVLRNQSPKSGLYHK